MKRQSLEFLPCKLLSHFIDPGLTWSDRLSMLEYTGYLKARVDLRLNDLLRLQRGEELCDRMIDFLLAYVLTVTRGS